MPHLPSLRRLNRPAHSRRGPPERTNARRQRVDGGSGVLPRVLVFAGGFRTRSSLPGHLPSVGRLPQTEQRVAIGGSRRELTDPFASWFSGEGGTRRPIGARV